MSSLACAEACSAKSTSRALPSTSFPEVQSGMLEQTAAELKAAENPASPLPKEEPPSPCTPLGIDPSLIPEEETASLYELLDVEKWEIRLLTLHWGPRSSEVECSIEKASLINPPSYIALSYCWGEPNKKEQISIRGRGKLNVTVNLGSALKDLRPFDKGAMYEHKLWIDAVCINQANTVERSQQIRFMPRIYSSAREVISWVPLEGMGWVSKSPQEAVEYLIKNRFDGKSTKTKDRALFRRAHGKRQRGKERYRSDTDSDMSAHEDFVREGWVRDGWKIMDQFFGLSYWTRVWVIQEIAVASKVRVLFGDIDVPWDDVAAILSMWKNDPDIASSSQRAFHKALHLLEFRERFSVKHQLISLLDAMRWSIQTEATDPRDKIFALLGLCHDGAMLVPVPNYKQPLEAIVTAISKAMMTSDRSLDLMCFKGTSVITSEILVIASWVPNWLNLWSSSTHSMTIHEATFSEWHTTFPFNPILEDSNSKVLLVQGKDMGNIRQVTSEMSKPGQYLQLPDIRALWISSTSTLSQENTLLRSPTPAQLSTRDSIWRTLTMDLLPPEMTPKVAALCFSKLWTPEGRGAVHNLALIDWIDRMAWFRYESWTLREWSQMKSSCSTAQSVTTLGISAVKALAPARISGLIASSEEDNLDMVQMVNAFIEALERVLGSGMRLAVIRQNHKPLTMNILDDFLKYDKNPWAIKEYIGMVPPNTQLGDQVWYVKGCSVPLVLREIDGGGREVIGGVYLDGGTKECFRDEEEWIRIREDKEDKGVKLDLR